MRILHLRGNRQFAQALRDVAEDAGHQFRWADRWEDLFTHLNAGPYDLAILYLAHPTTIDEQRILSLAQRTGGAMEIHLITDDQQLVLKLQATLAHRIKRQSLDSNACLLREPIQEVADHLAHIAITDRWEEIAPGVRLHRTAAEWTVKRASYMESLTQQETKILAALLEANGQLVPKAKLVLLAGKKQPLSQSALYAVISHLREKLEDDPRQPHHLLTMQRSGYLWRR